MSCFLTQARQRQQITGNQRERQPSGVSRCPMPRVKRARRRHSEGEHAHSWSRGRLPYAAAMHYAHAKTICLLACLTILAILTHLCLRKAPPFFLPCPSARSFQILQAGSECSVLFSVTGGQMEGRGGRVQVVQVHPAQGLVFSFPLPFVALFLVWRVWTTVSQSGEQGNLHDGDLFPFFFSFYLFAPLFPLASCMHFLQDRGLSLRCRIS